MIVNRDSGLDTLTAAGYPNDTNYIADIAELNSYTNVQTLDYVHTSYVKISYFSLTHNISIYVN